MSAFESPNEGDFDSRGLVGYIELISIVKIRIGVGSKLRVIWLL